MQEISTTSRLEINLFGFEDTLSHLVEKSSNLPHLLCNKVNRENMTLIKSNCRFDIPELKLYLCWNKNLVYIEIENVSYLCPFPYICMMQNKVGDIICAIFS